MDYEKQSGSQDSQPDGSQRLRCTLCPGKSFKDNNRLKIHVRGDQEGLFKLVMLNFIFKWYNWNNFRLLTASH
jgi:hypothetical protein